MLSRIFSNQANHLWFQINSDSKGSTGGQSTTSADPIISTHSFQFTPFVWMLLETALILLLFSAVAGQLPPDVNESHYLTKACLLYTSPSPRDLSTSRMPSSA